MADAVIVGKVSASSGPLVTAAGNTTTGSTFIVAVSSGESATVSSVTDSFGNEYVEVVAKGGGGFNNRKSFWICENGTGGTNHQATVAFTGSPDGTAYLVEVTGAAADSVDVFASGEDQITPYDITIGPMTQADSVLIFMIGGSSGGTVTHASSNTTIIDDEQDGASFWTSAVSKVVVSSTTAFTASFTGGDAGAGNMLTIGVAIKAAGAVTNYTITAEAGVYTHTGQVAGLLAGGGLTAEQGTYSLIGSEATRDIEVNADLGEYDLNGQVTALLIDRLMIAAQGSYALHGQSAALLYSAVAIIINEDIRTRRRMQAGRGFPFFGRI